jgi:phage terminase large subunit-like protein
MIESNRVREVPEDLERILVSIDPAGTNTRRSDETGIIVLGSVGPDFYVLEDASGHYSPNGWAQRALGLVDKWNADEIIAEKNYGGEMVRATLTAAMDERQETVRIVDVTSRRGKTIRADPVVAQYEKGRVHHVGVLEGLEDQQTSWVLGQSSPDRVDALVHGITRLAIVVAPASISSPAQFAERYGRTA